MARSCLTLALVAVSAAAAALFIAGFAAGIASSDWLKSRMLRNRKKRHATHN